MGAIRESIPEIEVTPEMVKAGLDELRDHHFGDDLSYIVEMIYRAMHYERLFASSKSETA